MPSSSSPMPRRRAAPILLALAALAFAVAGVMLYIAPLGGGGPAAVTTTPPLPLPATAQASRPPAAAPSLTPSFDVVRVGPGGSLVMAGTAPAGSHVTVHTANGTIGETVADAGGGWVMTPDAPLPPGGAQLTLEARTLEGRIVTADAPVLVSVPARTATGASAPAMAVIAPPNGPARLLQAPGAHTPGHALALNTVDYDEHGALRFAGAAPPGSSVRVYVDNAAVGDARVGADGSWTLQPSVAVPPGRHRLRVDQLTPKGAVASRVSMPFQRETLQAAQLAPGQVAVQPGQNLWRLARQAYGSGVRYTVIYLANKDHIRNANLIYPGQVFTVPTAPAAP